MMTMIDIDADDHVVFTYGHQMILILMNLIYIQG